jgi:hypothetical protein
MRIGLLAIGLLFLVGCSLAQIKVAHGTLGEDGTWSAVVYEGGGDLGVCLEIRATDREPDRLCGLRADNAGSWRPGAPDGGATFVAITSADQGAVIARTALVNGQELRTPVGAAPTLTDMRFFVIAVPPGATARAVDLLDGTGAIRTTLQLE